MPATWLCLPPVCPSKGRVNPGRLSSLHGRGHRMAASPSQQTHWLKLRVDLGLEQHSGMDPWLELDL